PVVAKINLHVLGIIYDPAHEVLQRFLQHGHYSAASSVFPSAAGSSAAASALGLVASGRTTEPLSGATKSSFASANFMTDSSYFSPLNFCQSPRSEERRVGKGCRSRVRA